MTLILQRQMGGEGSRWRSFGRFYLDDIDEVLKRASDLAVMMVPIRLRIVVDDFHQRPLAAWSVDSGWRMLEPAA